MDLLITSDRDPLSYGAGEPMRFYLRADGAPDGCRIRWRRTGDDGVVEEGVMPAAASIAEGPTSVSAAAARTELGPPAAACAPALQSAGLSRPGFVRIEADLLSSSGEALAHAEGGAGADVAAISADTPEPPDFDEFWARRKAELSAVPMDGAVCREIPSGRPDVRLLDVSLPCAGGRPCTGLLSVPVAGGPFPARVRLRGYNASWGEIARTSPPPDELCADALVLYLSAHGYEFNREPEYYDALRAASGSNGWDVAFDPVQNSDPSTAYFCGMAWRVMRGVEYIRSRSEWNGRDIMVFGGSQGGLQSIWAAALCEGVTECCPRIPWCCNMAGPPAGRAHGDWFVPWVPALAYYDPVNMARRIPGTCRVAIPKAGLGDYISPPSGVMAFYNALRCPKEATFVQGAMHFTMPPKPRQISVLKS